MKKKLFYLFSIFSLILSSCSSDSDNTVLVLPSKRVVYYPDEAVTTTFTYNKNKIVSEIDNTGEALYYTYTGDLITKIEYKNDEGKVYQEESFGYNSGSQLTSYVRINPVIGSGSKEIYTYDASGKISVKFYVGDKNSQVTETGSGTISFVNGDVSEVVNSDGEKRTYNYTNGLNTPFKNVLGLDKISFVNGEVKISKNLITSEKTESETVSYEILSNNDYPTLIIRKSSIYGAINTQFVY